MKIKIGFWLYYLKETYMETNLWQIMSFVILSRHAQERLFQMNVLKMIPAKCCFLFNNVICKGNFGCL